MRLFSSRPAARLALFAFIAALVLWLPAFRFPLRTGFGDWQFFMHMWEAGYVALTRYGEWPLWDPFHCGGITIFGNPQSQQFSPLYWLAVLAGPTVGSKLFVVVHAWAGLAGMYLLARRFGVSLPGALLAAWVFCASGFFAWHGATGHAAFLPFYFAPWVLLSLRAAVRDVRYAAALAALLTLVLLEGGVYPFPFLLLLIAGDALAQMVARRAVRPALVALSVAGVLTALMGAVRLWPILDELQRSPRTMVSSDGVSLLEVVEMLTARQHMWRFDGHEFVWAEYGCYVGWVVCALGLLGAVRSLLGESRSLLLGAVLFLALMLGDHGALSPWTLVHRLPIYDSLRVPSRFAVFLTLYLALLAGLGLDALSSWIGLGRAPGRPDEARRSRLAWTLLLVVAVDLLIVQYPTIDKWHFLPVRTDEVSPRFFLSTLNYGEYYASLPRMNLGSRECYEAMTFTPAPGLWAGDRPQARLVRGRGTVGPVSRTTSHASFAVALQGSATVLVNHNFAPGWQTNVGSIVSNQGRLAVELPAGEHQVVLSYRPTMLWPSIALSVVGALLALLLARRRELTGRREDGKNNI